MEQQATVETLAPEPVDLGAIYDKATAEAPVEDEAPEVSVETPEAPEAPVEAEAEEKPQETLAEMTAPPGNLPKAVRDQWGVIPADAREAIARSQLDMASKLAVQSRQLNGLNPIRDVLVTAAQELPHLAAMTPAQVAEQVMTLAKIGQQMNEKPAETLLRLADQHGVREQLKATLGMPSDQGTASLQAKIAQLEATITRFSDPEYLRAQAASVITERDSLTEVQTFAQAAEHWGEVEADIPAFIPIARAKLGESASAKDVLTFAYNAAVKSLLPEPKATPAAVVQTAAPSPEKAAEVMKAKSVNVAGGLPGKGRPLTEIEELEAAFERAQRK